MKGLDGALVYSLLTVTNVSVVSPQCAMQILGLWVGTPILGEQVSVTGQ